MEKLLQSLLSHVQFPLGVCQTQSPKQSPSPLALNDLLFSPEALVDLFVDACKSVQPLVTGDDQSGVKKAFTKERKTSL